ncbi:MAG TPA: bifunctional phosphoribosyl-AMP cyclohydrolase/phosphoribosyl-ATP diphosphatase HisIE [Nannocystaceae bacterium]|nr:bifunctional phosphoribosyl-AMP cyclohydrolase/phosphoribosyl-ATP diphosphatase HisIE [Nannocystaceae bacterium]
MSELDTLWSQAKPDDRGLVTAVVVHASTGAVLMVAMMTREALDRTLRDHKVTFFSRSRQSIWQKGETSGNTLQLVELRIDCDGDALLVRALPAGPTCHTGKPSCFHRKLERDALAIDEGPDAQLDAVLATVAAVIEARRAGAGTTSATGRSYVRELLAAGPTKVAAKIREEADELARAIEGEPDDRVAAEAADLLFHALVGLAARGLGPRDPAAVLAARFGTSGVDEKNARGS